MTRAKNSSDQKTSIIVNVLIGFFAGLVVGVFTKSIAYALTAGITGAFIGLVRHYLLSLMGYKLTKVS